MYTNAAFPNRAHNSRFVIARLDRKARLSQQVHVPIHVNSLNDYGSSNEGSPSFSKALDSGISWRVSLFRMNICRGC
jgi:hypothetical protein